MAAFEPEVMTILERQREILASRRDFMLAELPATGLEVPVAPDGAFYLYARLPEGAPTSDDYCKGLLDVTGVATTPGTDFGSYQAERYLRLSYAQPQAILEDALGRMVKYRL